MKQLYQLAIEPYTDNSELDALSRAPMDSVTAFLAVDNLTAKALAYVTVITVREAH